MQRNQILTAVVLLVALLSAVLMSAPSDAALQTANTLTLNVGETYLGPQVVLSGSVSSAAGVPTLAVVVENLDPPVTTVFDGAPTTGFRPPLGDPSASWRVPLDLVNGNYRITVTSSLGAEVLATDTADFEVLTEIAPPTEVFPVGVAWSYFDAGSEPPGQNGGGPPRQWYEATYDDSTWASGPAPLGYSSDQVTTTAATGAFGQKITAQYFRHEFDAPDLTDIDALTLSLRRDDGAVVYLNGTELGRTNMPAGVVNYGALANAVSDQTIDIAIDPADLVPGTNLLAVEVHQASLTSSDIVFSASLAAGAASDPLESNNTEGAYVLTAGDMARCNFDGDEAVAAQMSELLRADQGVFLGLGDLVYNSGTIDEFTNCYDPTLGQFIDITWPSPGNHEHYTMPNAAGYRQYFGPSAGPLAGPNGGLWYSFDLDEHWHVIALDSDCRGREALPGGINGDGCAVGSEQELWLRADLEANQDKNILAFFHHPPYTNNHYTDHGYTWPLWRALAEYGADITLHGHEHHYERYKPLDYWGDEATTGGITEFISGAGGTYPRYDTRPQEAESAFRGTFPRGNNDFGVLQLWLRPDDFEWKWESIYGLAAVDSGIGGLNDPMPKASLAGRVTDINDASVGIAGIEVCASAFRTGIEQCALTNASGNYVIEGLIAEDYNLSTLDPADNYLSADDPGVDIVAVNAPTPATYNFVMLPRPTLAGTVTTDGFGTGINNALVCAETNEGQTCANSGLDGTYEIDGLLPNREYQVTFSATDHVTECYDDQVGECSGAADQIAVGTLDIGGIDAALELNPGGISGRVTGEDTGLSLGIVEVCVSGAAIDAPSCTFTSSAGRYDVGDLPTGNYVVSFADTSGYYLPECYDASPCATPLFVAVSQPVIRTNIDASLEPVPPGGVGDPDCSVLLSVDDAQALLEYGVGSRSDGGDCPVVAATEVNVAAGDLNADGTTDLLDALLIAQCDVGVGNEWCP